MNQLQTIIIWFARSIVFSDCDASLFRAKAFSVGSERKANSSKFYIFNQLYLVQANVHRRETDWQILPTNQKHRFQSKDSFQWSNFNQKWNMKHIFNSSCKWMWIDNKFEIIDWTFIRFIVGINETSFDMHNLFDSLFAEFRIKFFNLKITNS